MRVLQVVALSPDGTELLLGARLDAPPTHRLAVDARLGRALRGDDLDGGPGAVLQLAPRDIQARLRRGASVEEVAAEAGVPAARIEHYAVPVRSEREQVIRTARAGVLLRPRSGRSAVPLGEAVAANLAATGYVRPETEEWSAVREDDGVWTLALRVVVRGRQRTARWSWHPARRELLALDAYAAAVGFVDDAPPAPRSRAARTAAGKRKPPARTAATGRSS